MARCSTGVSLLLALLATPALADDYAPPLYSAVNPPLAVAHFELTERSGAAVSPERLRGKVWVAHFFYTSCPGPCVKTMPGMQRLQQVFAGKPDVALVSITVNSEFDTPQLLQEYATAKGADPAQWLFLTGPEDKVYHVVHKSFYKPVEKGNKPQDPSNIMHSPQLLLIDRDGNLRGYVDGQDPAAVEALIVELRRLAGDKYLLPAVNASLNAVSAVLLIAGYLAIRRRRETLHIVCMLAALLASALFLTGYLYFHFVVQNGQPTTFRGEGWVRYLYYGVLLSHTLLAIAVAPLALYVAYQGLRDRRPRHVKVARWTLPVWLYVASTGVIVYWLLYQVYPPY